MGKMTTKKTSCAVAAVSFATLLMAFFPVPAPAGEESARRFGPPSVFSFSSLTDEARQLSAKPFQPPADVLLEGYAKLSYAQYQQIRFREYLTVWLGPDEETGIQLFHRGFLHKDKVEVSVVEGGEARRLVYDRRLFSFGDNPTATTGEDLGFAGFRLVRRTTNSHIDEYAVFLGASYFRAVASGQNYGLSARGLAIRTGSDGGEEFPVFRKFWIERVSKSDKTAAVYALLDSPSVAGAYRFQVSSGPVTRMSVEAKLFPRVALNEVGLAPGTSMFQFDGNSGRKADDYRPAVHDSDGLLIDNGRGERLWRPLANPADLQISDFLDHNPVGFGLMQRNTRFDHYQDAWARYDLRPSLWVQPRGTWGDGTVRLVEIPTDSEYFDNIVAYWRPARPIPAGREFSIGYELFWGRGPPNPGGLQVSATRQGRVQGGAADVRQFAIDFEDLQLAEATPDVTGGTTSPPVTVEVNVGEIRSVLALRLGRGWRVMFQLDPKGHDTVELRASLGVPGRSEVWVYRWTRASVVKGMTGP